MKMHHFLLAAVFGFAPAAHAALTAGLVGYFDFESNLNNQAAAVGSDYSGTFENGSLTETDSITDYTVGATSGRSGSVSSRTFSWSWSLSLAVTSRWSGLGRKLTTASRRVWTPLFL